MRKFKDYFMVFAVALIVFTACKEDDEKVNSADFMKTAAGNGKYEVATGRLAVSQGQDDSVKAFGQHMIEDHTLNNNELKALAAAKNVALPDTFPADKQAKYATLDALSGKAFDKAYAADNVAAHDETIALFENAADKADDADVRSWAAKTLPVLKMHREKAALLKTRVDAQ